MANNATGRSLFIVLIFLTAMAVGCRRAGYLDDRERDNRILIKAYELSNQGDFDSAVQLFNKVIEAYPRMARPHLDLALILHDRKQDYVKAIYHYNRYIDLREDTEKRDMIRDRIRQARRAFAAELSAEARIPGISVRDLQNENDTLKKQNSDLKGRVETLEEELAALREKERQEYMASVMGEDVEAAVDDDAVPETPEAPVSVEEVSQPSAVSGPESALARPQTVEARPESAERKSAGGSGKPESGVKPRSTVISEPGTYVVRPGDSLSKIANKVYGDGSKWHRIQDANRDSLGDGVNLRVGQVLIIP